MYKNEVEADQERISAEINNVRGELMTTINDIGAKRSRDKYDHSVAIQKLHDQVFQINADAKNKQNQYLDFKAVISSIVDIIKTHTALDIQDEEDKRSIALWGVQERGTNSKKDYSKMFENIRKPNDQNKLKLANVQKKYTDYNVVTLDKTCYSCASQGSIVLSAFKMACLSYVPSQIDYENKIYDRYKLFEILTEKVVDLRSRFNSLNAKHDFSDQTAEVNTTSHLEYIYENEHEMNIEDQSLPDSSKAQHRTILVNRVNDFIIIYFSQNQMMFGL